VKFDIFYNKYLSVKQKIKYEYSVEIDNYFQTYLKKDITIPIGYCHGDLTLSNILLKEETYYLIDFLDSFF